MVDIALHLKSHGIRPSIQRMAIMEYLMSHPTHPTVDVIYCDLLPSMPTLSRTTIYNTLELFREKGAIRVLNIDNKTTRYDGDLSIHAHFLCRKCGKIYDIDIPESVYMKVKLIPKHHVDQTEINYSGTCSECEAFF